MPVAENRTTEVAAIAAVAKRAGRRDVAELRELALRLNRDWAGRNSVLRHHLEMLLNSADAVDQLIENLKVETPAGHGDEL